MRDGPWWHTTTPKQKQKEKEYFSNCFRRTGSSPGQFLMKTQIGKEGSEKPPHKHPLPSKKNPQHYRSGFCYPLNGVSMEHFKKLSVKKASGKPPHKMCMYRYTRNPVPGSCCTQNRLYFAVVIYSNLIELQIQ